MFFWPTTKLSQATVGQKIALSGASLSTASGIWSWLGENHEIIASIGVLVGIIVGVIGLVIQARAIRRRDKRELELHRLHIEKIRGQDVDH